MSITLEVLNEKIDGINKRLDHINGGIGRQWDEIQKLKMESTTIQGHCTLEEERISSLKKTIKDIPDVGKSLWKFALWLGAIMTMLNGAMIHFFK